MNKPSLHSMASEVGEDAPLLSTKVFYCALSFGLFGLLGMLMSLTLLPLMLLIPIGARRRHRYTRWVLSRFFPLYIRFMEWCKLIKIRRHGCDRLKDGGQLIIANHPSLLDVVYLIATVKNANCVAKRSVFFNPFTAGIVRAAGYIRNDSPTLLEDCAASLAAGDNLIVFPEGTRTSPNKPFRFLRGTANVALAAGCDIRPIVIRSNPARLMKHQAWYEMSTETLNVDIETLPPIRIKPYLENETRRSKTARVLTTDLENFYRGL
ncbi:MAG: lysophospholipid acyltransferase family protein [Pseudomonadota bacterium]